MATSKETFPDFSLKTSNAKDVALADLTKEGKPVLFRFTTTHCEICKAENPELIELVKDPNGGATFVDINIGESAEEVNDYKKEQGLSHDVLLDSDSSLTSLLAVLGTPTHIAVNKDGKICQRRTGRITSKEIHEWINQCQK